MFNFNSHQEKVDFAHNDILQMIPKNLKVKKNKNKDKMTDTGRYLLKELYYKLQHLGREGCAKTTLSTLSRTYLDLLYSNSMCKQSSMPTSIFILLFASG